MKTIATNIPDRDFEIFEKRVDELGISKSDYIKKLVYDDIGIKHGILKPTSNNGMLGRLKKVFGVVEEPKTVPKKVKQSRNGRSPNSIWNPTQTDRKATKGEIILKGERIMSRHLNSLKKSYTAFLLDINEVLFLDEYYTKQGHFIKRDIAFIGDFLNIRSESTVKTYMAYIVDGVFDKIINEFKSKMDKITFTCTSDGKIAMNNGLTSINVNSAREIIAIVENKGFSERLVLDLQKAYDYAPSLEVRIICENYNNSQLLNLLRQPNKNVVLNNPSKRRNVIRNNGVI
jgi:hypothetical protein